MKWYFFAALVAGLFVVACGNAAMARPRDQAMSAAFQCGGYENTRDWLDCYYGAAQPVRTGLGISPPTPRQLQLATAPAAAASPAAADVTLRDQVLSDAARCAAIEQDYGWLDCYYAAAQPVRTSLRLAPAPQAAAGPPPLHAAMASLPVSGRAPVRIQSYAFDSHGWFTVTLENGEVWQQVSGDTDYAHWNLPAQKYAVRFASGFMGSTNMRVVGHGGSYKVLRVR